MDWLMSNILFGPEDAPWLSLPIPNWVLVVLLVIIVVVVIALIVKGYRSYDPNDPDNKKK
jgi:hypothetical protein